MSEEMELSAELMQKMAECRTAEELIALAKANNMEITAEQAEAAIQKLSPVNGELSDDELDNVSGGGVSLMQFFRQIFGGQTVFKKGKIVFIGDTLPDTGGDDGLIMS
ncbi:MAG: hypothetical protein LUD16_08040 [Lachnospiraceae bacterium]|nr:hypothetical protein [Lachnospiraceae bacterium]